MVRICSTCGYVSTAPMTYTFKHPVTGTWSHYCSNHINNIDKNLIHLPFPDQLHSSKTDTYSGRCKVCVEINHEFCLGYWPIIRYTE